MKKYLVLVAVLASIFALPAAQAAGIQGDTVNVSYYFPDSSTVYQNLGTQVISGAGDTFNFSPYLSLLVTSNQIVANNFGFSGTWTPSSFNGFIVTDLTKNFTTAYSVDGNSNMGGLTNANVTTSGNTVAVNWGGLSFGPGTVASFTAVSAVPEPTEGALLLSGIGLLGFIAARRNKTA